MARPAPLTMQPMVPSRPTKESPAWRASTSSRLYSSALRSASSSGCLNRPLSSSRTLASAATSRCGPPSATSASGLTSTREASFSCSRRSRARATSRACGTRGAGNTRDSVSSRASGSGPASGSKRWWTIFCGSRAATSSMSTPPEAEAMHSTAFSARFTVTAR